MNPITASGLLAFFVVSLTVGVRLLLLWRSTRQLPELLIGMGVLGIGPCGFSFAVGASLLAGAAPGFAHGLWIVACLAMGIGGAATYVFTWYVFRRDRIWAATLSTAAGLGFAVLFGMELLGEPYIFSGSRGGAYYVGAWLRIGCLCWASLESIRYYALMRRRRQIGLADPVVSNRFLLWGVGIGSAGFGSIVGTVAQMALGAAPEPGWLHLSNSSFGMAAAIAMWLAFLPPAAYTRWVAVAAPQEA